jgi:hypothetical protein
MIDLKNKKWMRFGFASIIAWIFLAFVVSWVFLIPLAVVVFLIFGYTVYMKDRKHRITTEIKPTEAMKALARRENELKKEKEKILYEEFHAKTER